MRMSANDLGLRRLARAACLLAPLATGTAAPAHGQDPLLRFAVIGDYGSASRNAANFAAERNVAQRVAAWNPAFVITLGDNNYETGSASTIDFNIGQFYHSFIFPYRGQFCCGATVNRFFPSLGNHDWATAGAGPYLDYFTLPGNERYYEFVRGPVHFFAVDSDTHEPDGTSADSAQAFWLRERLAASTSPWKIVYFHHPPFSTTRVNPRMRWPYREWGADVVLAGHEHNYERLVVDGFTYLVNGLGGAANITRFGSRPPAPGSVVRYDADFGAQLVEATAEDLAITFITRTGASIDTFTLAKGDVLSGFFRIMARHSGKAVVVQGASTTNGANVFQWTYGGSATNDEWRFRHLGGGFYALTARHSGQAMNVRGASSAEGADIIQWPYGGAATNDEWRVERLADGDYRLLNRHSSKVAEVVGGGTANGADVVQATWTGAAHQRFQIVRVP